MGRPDGLSGTGGLGQERGDGTGAAGRQEDSLILPCFPHAFPDALPAEYESYGIYTRLDAGHALGEADEGKEDKEWKPISRCFNCGHEEHSVKECPFRLNRDLIELSRQYYQFSKGTIGTTNWERVHTAEGWRQTRLNWLEDFEPGVIRGRLLREALGDGAEGEWLRNIAIWGYPKGWVGEHDPREAVRERIWAEYGGGVDLELDDAEPFVIHGDEGTEVVTFRDAFVKVIQENGQDDESEDGPEDGTEEESEDCSPAPQESLSRLRKESLLQSETSQCASPSIRRWATYPSSHFLSNLLPIHTGFNLPPVDSASTNAYPSLEPRRPPAMKFDWDVWAASHVEPEPPPPPPDEPPPLPPEPGCIPPRPTPLSRPRPPSPSLPPMAIPPVLPLLPADGGGEESDMDLSEPDSE